MSRFKRTQDYSRSNGTTLTLMAKHKRYLPRLNGVILAHLDRALRRIERTMGQLNAPTPNAAVLKYAHRYFLTPKDSVPDYVLNFIKPIIVQVQNGLSGDVTIKTGGRVGSGNSDDNGEVNFTTADGHKSYHNRVFDYEDKEMVTTGAIKIDKDRLTQGILGMKTLIHEASHKYAGTTDYCYFKDDGETPRTTFDDLAQAVINADSYAWFIVKLGRSWNGTAH